MSDDSSIPGCWARAMMQDIAMVVGGSTPSTKDSAFWKDGHVPWITPADLSGYRQKTISRGARNITRRGLERSGARLLPTGTVLFSSRAPIGYVAIASNPVSTNQGFKSFVLETGIAPDYIYYYLQFAKHLALSLASGTTFQELSGQKAQRIPVVLAPLGEQHRVVEAIESHLSRLDAAITSLERVQSKLKAYRASVLKAAVEGRLVPTEAALARAEKRDYEPADALLTRVLSERRRRWEEAELAKLKAKGKTPKDDTWKEEYEKPTAPDVSSLLGLPEGWCWASLDQLSYLVHNGQPKAPREKTGVRTLRISAVRPLAVNFEDVRYLPGKSVDYPHDLIEVGDLLFTRYNGTPSLVGVCGRVRDLTEPTVHPDKIIKVRLCSDLSVSYLELAANAGESRRLIERRTRTTAGQAGISGADLKQMPIPLPPLVEQGRIADETERLISVADETKVALVHNERRCLRLRQAVLKWAFEGKLVDQDPNDEPVDDLLARIRTERAAVAPIKKTRGRKTKATA